MFKHVLRRGASSQTEKTSEKLPVLWKMDDLCANFRRDFLKKGYKGLQKVTAFRRVWDWELRIGKKNRDEFCQLDAKDMCYW